MKKIIIASALVMGSFSAFAATTTVCNGSATPTVTAPAAGGTGEFMVTAITPKCSANVFLIGEDANSGASYAVGAASAKGKNSFLGTTDGGAVKVHEACAVAGACTSTDAGDAKTAAAASSS